MILYLLVIISSSFANEWVWFETTDYWQKERTVEKKENTSSKKVPTEEEEVKKEISWKEALNPKSDLFYESDKIAQYVMKNKNSYNMRMYKKWAQRSSQHSSEFLAALVEDGSSKKVVKKKKKGTIPNVKYYYSSSCGACKSSIPALLNLRQEMTLEMISVDSNVKDEFLIGNKNRIASKKELVINAIRSTPTIFFINSETKETIKVSGMPSKKVFQRYLEEV